MRERIEDGFGNAWSKCDRADCSLQIVRPGKTQCDDMLVEGEFGKEWVQPCFWNDEVRESRPNHLTQNGSVGRAETVAATDGSAGSRRTVAQDDIVTRLRAADYCDDDSRCDNCMLCDDAADEIEWLRAVIRELQMLIAVEADMAVDEAMTDAEREAEVWVRPREPRKRITSNIVIKPGKELHERYGGDRNAWALDIAEKVKRYMRDGEARQ